MGVSVGAILLVGGRSRRMGGGYKPLLEVGGTSLFARAVEAVSDAGCAPIIAAGPVLDESAPVLWVREDPPFTGPVAGIAAALELVPEVAPDRALEAAPEGGPEHAPDGAPAEGPQWTLILAGDLPYASQVVERLIAAAREPAARASDAFVFRADGYPQWLAGIYRTTALRAARVALGDKIADAPVRALLGGLEIVWLTDEDGITADVDTPADLTRIRAALEEEP